MQDLLSIRVIDAALVPVIIFLVGFTKERVRLFAGDIGVVLLSFVFGIILAAGTLIYSGDILEETRLVQIFAVLIEGLKLGAVSSYVWKVGKDAIGWRK